MKNKARFTEPPQFDRPVTIKVGKFEVSARLEYDEGMGEPWKEHDGHGEVSDWTRRKKAPGERVLYEDRGSFRYYDFEGAIKIAKRDGWDAPPFKTGTAGERAARAVEADFKFLRDWCRSEWCWVGVVLSVSAAGHVLDKHAASLWGIESNAGDFLTDVANELLNEGIDRAKATLEALCAVKDG